jgi:hypothetical protein
MFFLALLAAWLGANVGASLVAQAPPRYIGMRDSTTDHDRIVILEERIESRDSALALQAAEYERRLQQLNGEQGRITNILKESIPREVFENYVKENLAWREKTDRALILIEGRAGGTGSAAGFFFQIVPLIISLVALGLLLWRRRPQEPPKP